MLKFILILAFISLTMALSISTPLLAEIHPQPAEAPANTKHASYVEAISPVYAATAPLIATSAVIPAAVTTVQHLPYAYAAKYLTYATPAEVSHYRIAY